MGGTVNIGHTIVLPRSKGPEDQSRETFCPVELWWSSEMRPLRACVQTQEHDASSSSASMTLA